AVAVLDHATPEARVDRFAVAPPAPTLELPVPVEPRPIRRAAIVMAAFVALAASPPASMRSGATLPPRFAILADASGNTVAYRCDDGAIAVGVLRPDLLSRLSRQSDDGEVRPRYAVAVDGEGAPSFGDGGLRQLGVVTVGQEKLARRIRAY